MKKHLTHSWLSGLLEPFLGGMVAASKSPASALGSEELNEGENSISRRCCFYRHGVMQEALPGASVDLER